MATATSVTNVFTDVARKKVVNTEDVVAATVWFRIVACVMFGAVLLLRAVTEAPPVIRDGGALFDIGALHLSPLPTFLIYLAIDAGLVGFSTFLYGRALQTSPLSLCIPFLAFTPIFLIVTGYLTLGELPAWIKLLGVVLVVAGSLVMHRSLFAVSLLEPLRAVVRERGSRYMLFVALILSITNPIDKKLVVMSDAFTQSFAYGVALCVFFFGFAFAKGADWRGAIRRTPGWIVIAGALDATALLLQFSSHNYIDVVITISIKRAGIILAVLMGWLIFRERNITDKVIAASVMLAGVLILYLPLTAAQALLVVAFALAGMSVALRLTRASRFAPADLAAMTASRAESEPVDVSSAKTSVLVD